MMDILPRQQLWLFLYIKWSKCSKGYPHNQHCYGFWCRISFVCAHIAMYRYLFLSIEIGLCLVYHKCQCLFRASAELTWTRNDSFPAHHMLYSPFDRASLDIYLSLLSIHVKKSISAFNYIIVSMPDLLLVLHGSLSCLLWGSGTTILFHVHTHLP
jgi:hypothetical protein